MTTQYLESHGADFEDLVWKFQIGYGDNTSAGTFAITPLIEFKAIQAQLSYARDLLREYAYDGHSDALRSKAEKFFDPEPL